MRVGICDDERIWLTEAEKIIKEYGKRTSQEMEIYSFANRQELLQREENLDVLFLDIELEQENGVELAREVNQRWPNCQIVYLTNYLFYATEVYHTIHVFYVLKQQFSTRIDEVFAKVLHELSQREKQLVFDKGNKTVILAPEEILYFERKLRVTRIKTTEGDWEIPDKLNDILKKLPPLDFVRCHNSYVVYFPAVREMQAGMLLMNDGEKITISRAYTKAVKEAFARWALTQLS